MTTFSQRAGHDDAPCFEQFRADQFAQHWQAAIFDLDGTLLDSMSIWQENLYQLLLDHGIIPPEDLINITKTLGMNEAICHLVNTYQLAVTADEAVNDFYQRMLQAYTHTLQLKPNALAYLKQLRQAQVPLVIATATVRPLVLAVLDRLALLADFQLIMTVADVGVGKHDPAIFLSCCEQLNLEPEHCVVFEDSLQAILTANAAGFTTVAIDEPTAILEKPAIIQQRSCYVHNFSQLLS